MLLFAFDKVTKIDYSAVLNKMWSLSCLLNIMQNKKKKKKREVT